jgi:hypothetical protein
LLRLAVALALALGACSAAAEDVFNAGFEVVLKAGNDDHWQIRSTARVQPGKDIELGFDPYVVSLAIEPRSAKRFDLRVTVRDNAAGLEVGGRKLEQSFPGTFGGIVEFEASNAELNVSGAIAVSRVTQ